MNTQEQLPDWYAAETRAHEVVQALDRATKDLSMALMDQDIAHFIKLHHDGTTAMSSLRLQNDLYEITGGKQV